MNKKAADMLCQMINESPCQITIREIDDRLTVYYKTITPQPIEVFCSLELNTNYVSGFKITSVEISSTTFTPPLLIPCINLDVDVQHNIYNVVYTILNKYSSKISDIICDALSKNICLPNDINKYNDRPLIAACV